MRRVRARSWVCSRTSAMLKLFRLSTRTFPYRSSSTPRGAGSGSFRRWFSSAISRNFSCCATWKIQNPMASAAKADATTYCMTVNRVVRLRRSSGISGVELISVPSTNRGGPAPAAKLEHVRPPFGDEERGDADGAVDQCLNHGARGVEPYPSRLDQRVQRLEAQLVNHRRTEEHQESRHRRRHDELGTEDANK